MTLPLIAVIIIVVVLIVVVSGGPDNFTPGKGLDDTFFD